MDSSVLRWICAVGRYFDGFVQWVVILCNFFEVQL